MEKKRRSRDFNQLAAQIVAEATSEEKPTPNKDTSFDKNPAAVVLGRLGGLKGGKARAESLSKKRRSEIARKAAKSRWTKK